MSAAESRPPAFQVTVDAASAAEFRAKLEHLVRQGVAVDSPQGLHAGAVCLLRISSRDGLHQVAAQGAVVRALPGVPPKLLVCPTKYGKVTSKDAAAAAAPPRPSAPSSPPAAAAPAQPAPEPPAPVVAQPPAPAVPDAAALELPSEALHTAAVPLAAAPELDSDTGVSSSAGPSPALQAAQAALAAQEAQPELKPFELVGSYQVLRHLGGGGMADVYLARSLLAQGVDKVVALKTVREEFGPQTPYGAMFLNEARVSATLQHPNIVQVFDFGEAAGRPYLAMEYVHGRDLVAILRLLRTQQAPVPPAIAVAICIRLCEALEYVHEKKDLDGRPLHLVHRDVSPANVLVTGRAEVKLMDFGVAAAALPEGQARGMMVGKLPYMPAEQMVGMPPSPGWDLYPVGVTLYQLLALQHPWQGNPSDYLLMPALRIRREPPSTFNPAVPPALDALVARATDLEPSNRPESARALREELEAVAKDLGPVDLGAWVRSLFGPALDEEQRALEELTAEGRRRSAQEVPGFVRPLVAPLAALRQRYVYSRLGKALARRKWLARSVVALLLLAVVGGGGGGALWARDRAARLDELARADAQAAAGRLVGPGEGDALDVLLRARERWPGEPRVTRRLAALADTFEALAAAALERDALEEAAAHLEAALRADPGRTAAQQKLRDIEEAVKAASRDKVVKTP